jgi:hypothetical protein
VDIVERLRDRKDQWWDSLPYGPAELMDEAAAEINRLRRRVVVLDKCQDRIDCLCRGE